MLLLFQHVFCLAQTPVPNLDQAITAEDSLEDMDTWFHDYLVEHPGEALSWEGPLQRLTQNLKKDAQRGQAHKYLGILFFFNGRQDESIYHYGKAYQHLEAVRDSVGMVSVMANISNVMQEKGDFTTAADMLYQSIKIVEGLGNTEMLAKLHYNLGNLMALTDKKKAAGKAYLKAGNYAREIGSATMEGHAWLGVGSIAYQLGEDSLAVGYIGKALARAEELGDIYMLSQALTNLSVVNRRVLGPDSVIQMQRRIYSLDSSIGNPWLIANSSINLGSSLARIGRFQEALPYLEGGIDIYVTADIQKDLAGAYEHLMSAYEDGGQYEKAYAYSLLWKAASDSIQSIEVKTGISELEKRYQTEKQVQKIGQLKQLNEKERAKSILVIVLLIGLAILAVFVFLAFFFYAKKRSADQAQKSIGLEHRLLRTQMNPHFLFNSLNSLQKFYIDRQFEKGNEYLSDFAQMLRWILDHSSRDYVSLEEELETLKNYVGIESIRLGNSFEYNCHLDEELEPEFIKLPPLILQPFVENAIWHGIMPAGHAGKLKISLEPEGDELLRCVIRDNGIGYSTSLKRKGKTTRKSHGIEITEERLGANGKVSIQERIDEIPSEGGTEVTLLIPIHYD